MLTVRAVLFDLGNVLCTIDVGRLRRAWEAGTGLPWAALEDSLLASGLKRLLDTGAATPEEVTARVAAATGVALDVARFSSLWGTVLGPWPEANALAARVAQQVPTGLLSNTDPLHHAQAQALCPALAGMTAQTVSYEVGAQKPERAIYDAAVAAMGVPAGEILFLDDLDENVAGARAAGLRAEQVRTLADMERALASVGLRGLGAAEGETTRRGGTDETGDAHGADDPDGGRLRGAHSDGLDGGRP